MRSGKGYLEKLKSRKILTVRGVMNYIDDIKILLATSQQEFDDAIELFKEYANAINFDAGFKNFRAELASLNTHYSAPDGCLLLAYKNNEAVGCIAVRKMQQGVAELKRFYVKPNFRQFKVGARLLDSAVANAKQLHFHYLRLEVIPTLTKAKELYHSFGFYSIEPYQTVALEGTAYMEKNLLTTVD